MRKRAIGIIFKKQITELLRDKRTVFVIFILPVLLYPLMIVGFAQLSIFLVGRMEAESFRIANANPQNAPDLVERIEADTQLVIVECLDPDSALLSGSLHLILEIPDAFEDEIAAGESGSLRILYDGAEERSEVARSKLRDVVFEYERSIVTDRVTSAGFDSSFTQPVLEEYENVASGEEMGGMIFGRILAMILVLMVITGTYYASIDMVAGEKERGTLETLLVSPVGRLEIVFGKYLTVLVLGLLNALLNLASMGITLAVGLNFIGNQLGQSLSISITPGMLGMILIELLPLAALFSAVFLAISSFAKSYKEAQGFLTPVFVVAELPAMVALLPGIEISTGTALVPVLNVALLIKKMMVGGIDPLHIFLVWASTAAFAAIALRWASSIVSNEEALLSESDASPLARIFSRGRFGPAHHAGGSDALFLFAFAVLLLFWIGTPLQASGIVRGLIITELALVALPPLLLVKRLKLDVRETFRLKRARAKGLLEMVIMAAAGFILITQIQVIFNRAGAIPTEYIRQFESMFEQFSAIGGLGTFAVIALLPAICEEFLFRGYILDGLTRRWGAVAGIIVSGVLFGAFHLDPIRLIPVSILGIVFGAIVWRRNSILYGMVGHLVNNGLAFGATLVGESVLAGYLSDEGFAPIWLISTAAIVFFGMFALLWLMPKIRARAVMDARD